MSYYIRYDGTYYKMDATTEISVTYPARLTEHPLHSRKSASDNYIVNSTKATIKGIITDIKTTNSANLLPTGEYIDEFVKLMSMRVPLYLKHRLDGEEEDGWFITSFNPSQNQRIGYGGSKQDGSVVQSFEINMTLQRALLAQGLRTDVVVAKGYEDALQKKNSSSKSTLQVDPETTAAERARARAAELRNTKY